MEFITSDKRSMNLHLELTRKIELVTSKIEFSIKLQKNRKNRPQSLETVVKRRVFFIRWQYSGSYEKVLLKNVEKCM